jgi:hypothetical protein
MTNDELPDAALDSTASEATSPAAGTDRIVELCSAANCIEAHAIQALLQDNGVKSQVVGEALGGAAGCVPLGETIAPRIWVRAGDARRAREVVEEWAKQPHEDDADLLDDEQIEDDEELDEDVEPLPSDARFRWLSQGFFIAGLACILFGSVWALQNWMTLHSYQGMAEGRLADFTPRFHANLGAPLDENIPIPRQKPRLSFAYDARYVFVACNRMTYYAEVHDAGDVDNPMPVLYDLQHPERNIVGPIASPWIILGTALASAVFLSFVGYQFR